MKRFLFGLCLVFSLCGCKTLVKTEYEYVLPELNFPSWPNPGPVDFPMDEATGAILVPVDYFRDLYNYKKDVEALEEFYKKCEAFAGEVTNGREE